MLMTYMGKNSSVDDTLESSKSRKARNLWENYISHWRDNSVIDMFIS